MGTTFVLVEGAGTFRPGLLAVLVKMTSIQVSDILLEVSAKESRSAERLCYTPR